ncbi:MAG: MFS transporter [Candidatus Aenigmatarchaeota archaeon]
MDKLKFIYLFDFFLNLAIYVISPFLAIYARSLSFSESFIGIFSGILSFSAFFGFIFSFFIRKNEYFFKQAFLTSLFIYGFSWLLFFYAKTEFLFLLITIILTISGGIFNLLYTSFILKSLSGKTERFVNISFTFASAYIISSLVSGFIISKYGFIYPLFFFPFLIFIFLILFFFKIEEKIKIKVEKMETNFKISKNFLKFTSLLAFFYFAVGISSPYFPILLTEEMKLTSFDWAIVGIVEMLSFIILFPSIRLIAKKYTPKTLLLFSTFFISFIPLVWVITKNYLIILLFSIISGISWRIFSFSYLSYLSLITKNYFSLGLFSVSINLAYSLGSFVSSIIISFFDLEALFYTSSLLRFFSCILFLSLEKKKLNVEEFLKELGTIVFSSFNILTEIFEKWFKLILPKSQILSPLYPQKSHS